MSGGVGSRFWPVSRETKPKQFLPLFGDRSLIQRTYDRLSPIVDRDHIYVSTGERYRDLVLGQLPFLEPSQLLLEPVGKNTAPCIGYASAFISRRQGEETVTVFLPSDHDVGSGSAFADVLRQAMDLADEKQAVVTIGIKPNRAETGYGYLRAAEQVPSSSGEPVYRVDSFVEKPDQDRARRYLRDGSYYWNAGIFVSSVRVMIDAFARHLPSMYEGIESIGESLGGENEEKAVREFFSGAEAVSIDYGIMEKLTEVYLIESRFDWNDLGSWESAYELSEKDRHGHAGTTGKVVSIDSENCHIEAGNKTVALVGVRNLVIISSEDAILICERERSQDVRRVVDSLKDQGRKELL